jgi:hypothetical protein
MLTITLRNARVKESGGIGGLQVVEHIAYADGSGLRWFEFGAPGQATWRVDFRVFAFAFPISAVPGSVPIIAIGA